ncbi:hypothetical protein [Limosilactobacillus fermentum]|jgi:uncharacterized phage infection (PIP) family protein YhgE|uniref:hypothetical protein n=1 Tax=Limosilactobacillus fermentum TaxID=1613 RepID=UPI00209BBE26|nr:hypothetical protein [Limosilactobacillus fermentum]MCO8299439.1 hypothetical protein [Limosilactobacillus fermentum]MCQ2007107.1 hypothetical protein [Limosilactobacillus fermentum]
MQMLTAMASAFLGGGVTAFFGWLQSRKTAEIDANDAYVGSIQKLTRQMDELRADREEEYQRRKQTDEENIKLQNKVNLLNTRIKSLESLNKQQTQRIKELTEQIKELTNVVNGGIYN